MKIGGFSIAKGEMIVQTILGQWHADLSQAECYVESPRPANDHYFDLRVQFLVATPQEHTPVLLLLQCYSSQHQHCYRYKICVLVALEPL